MEPIIAIAAVMFVIWLVWRAVVITNTSTAARNGLPKFNQAVQATSLNDAISNLPGILKPMGSAIAQNVVPVPAGADPNACVRALLASYHRALAAFPDPNLFLNGFTGTNHVTGNTSAVLGTSLWISNKLYAWVEVESFGMSVRWKLFVAEVRARGACPYNQSHFTYPETYTQKTDSNGKPEGGDKFGRDDQGAMAAKGLMQTAVQIWTQTLQNGTWIRELPNAPARSIGATPSVPRAIQQVAKDNDDPWES